MDELRTIVASIPDGFLTAFILFLLLAGPRFFERLARETAPREAETGEKTESQQPPRKGAER